MNSNLFKPDPAYQQHVPNLDGGDEASEHILFGTNIDCENGVERGEGRLSCIRVVYRFYYITPRFLILQVNLLHFLIQNHNLKYKLLSTT